MGSGKSTHATNFERPPQNPDNIKIQHDDIASINISNKMVERLVEDVAVKPKPVPKPQPPKSVFKDRYFNEKLNSFDEQHSRQWGLTLKDLKTIANRIEKTSSPVMKPDPICQHCAEQVLECYEVAKEPFVCNGAVETFNNCVRKAMRDRVYERTHQAARTEEERLKNIALAKENVRQKLGQGENEEAIAA